MTKHALTDPFLRGLKPAEKGKRYSVADKLCPGLKVRVTDKGRASFILWRRVPGQGLNPVARLIGEVGTIGLADARKKAGEWIALIKAGQDPAAVEEQRKADEAARVKAEADKNGTTFKSVWSDYEKLHLSKKRSCHKVSRDIARDVAPTLGSKAITAITRKDILDLLDVITKRSVYAGLTAFSAMSAFFNWVVDREKYGLVVSPMANMKPKRLVGEKNVRQRVLSDAELRAFWVTTGKIGYPYGDCFRLLLLTGGRLNEIARARWREIDLKKKVLEIPAARFKSGTTHLIPLNASAIALLEAAPRWKKDFVFSMSGELAINGFSKVKAGLDDKMREALGETELPGWVLHDLRRTVRTRLASLKTPDHVSEKIIGHGRKGLQRVYDQHTYQDEMAEALQRWNDLLLQIVTPKPPALVVTNNVVSLAKRKRA